MASAWRLSSDKIRPPESPALSPFGPLAQRRIAERGAPARTSIHLLPAARSARGIVGELGAGGFHRSNNPTRTASAMRCLRASRSISRHEGCLGVCKRPVDSASSRKR